MRPDDFWSLSTQEFWWEFDDKVGRARDLRDKFEEGAGKTVGGFTSKQWAEARKRHTEKMSGRAK